MKRKLTLLLTAFLLLSGMKSWGQFRTEASIDFSEQGYVNAQDMDGIVIDIDENVTIVFNKAEGTNSPKYYNSGTAIRVYGGNNFVVSSNGTITSITLTFSIGEGSNEIITEVGSFESPEWTGSESEVTFTIGGTTGHRRIKGITVIYSDGGQQPNVATPTFTPPAGTYYEAQSVSIACTTDGATIYYSIVSENGPWTEYTEAIIVNETTTIWAYAEKEGYNNSPVVSATYTIAETPNLITIAEARALAIDEYALVQGVVTFIDARNVYIQDATAAIDLYLNANAPSTLALGDLVQAYGKKAVYKGLVELSNIDATDAEQFSVISSGNELPIAVKTIAEILSGSDAEGSLQATRVKVEGATIGAINTSGNTPLTQDGSTINIYKVPALTGIEEGDVVDVVSIIGYYNAPQLRVALASDVVLGETPVTPDPQLTVSVSELSGLDYVYGAGPSEIQSFEVSGENLTHNVTVSPSENFEVSTLSGDLFQPESPISIDLPESGSLSSFVVYVRLKAGLEAGTYSEQITVTSEGAETLYVSVTGTVTGEGPTPPPTPTGNYVRINDLNQLTEGSFVIFAARFDGNATDYYAMSNASSGKPAGVLFTSATADDNEVLPASIVDEELNYYWIVGITANGYTFTNALGELIGYTSSTNFATGGDNTEWSIEFSTAGDEAMVPNYSGFLVTNVNNDVRHFALNSSHNFGPYHSNNLNNSGYNFYLDLFVKSEGGVPPTPTVVAPTFTPAAGTYYEAQTVSIACTTDGATIYYSTVSENGPWTAYTEAITVNETTTIWAYAVKEDYNDSPVVSATYTIAEAPNLITIAEARALAIDEYALVQGVVTFIDARNVYIQDATAAIDLYLNANAPSTLALGDLVQAYGKKAVYKGLVELSNIDATNAEQFSVISSGNELPLAVKTIAEILAGSDAEGSLQATRVKVEGATIGAINTSGNTPLTQDGSTINIYKVPALTGIEEGDVVDVVSIIGYYNAPQLRVALASDVVLGETPVTPDPQLTVSVSELSGLDYVYGAGPSEIQPFEVGGENLTHNVTVSPSENFEVSTLSGDLFQPESPISIDLPESGSLSGFVVYVRLKAGLDAGTYSEQIVVTSEGADTLYVNVTGTVTGEGPTPPPTPTGNYVRINDLNQLTEGSFVIFAARFDDNTTDYYAMSGQSSGKPAGVLFTSATADDNEVLPASIVDEEENYYWIVGLTANGYTFTNALGELIGYTSSTNFATGGDNTEWSIEFSTAGDEAMVPNYSGFLVTNVNNNVRHFALNSNHNFGPYHSNNLNNSGYNFYLDLFVKSEGGVPPTPTVAAPSFTPAAGTYYEAQTVSIACATDGATIYFTLDGTDPAESSPVYSTPIIIEETTTVKAIAMKEGYNNSNIVEATYTIQLGVVTIFSQDWEGEMNGWTFVTVEGDKPWNVSQYQGNHYAYANGYNGGVNEQWCISPAFNINDYQNVTLSFRTAKNYTGPDLELKYSTNYDGVDPTTANWWTFDFNMSPGSYTWTESGNIPISVYPQPASNCYIAFKYTSTETEAAAWEVDDIILRGSTSVPNLTVTPSSLSGFTHVVGEGPSDSQYFTISGVNIGPAPGGGSTGSVIMQVLSNEFEISLDNETFSWQVYIDDINGTLPPTPVYVRMNGAEVGQYTATVTIHASSSDQATVALSGTVTEPPVPGDDYVRIMDAGQLVAGNKVILASRYNETIDAYLAIGNTLSSGKLPTTEFTSELVDDDEVLPQILVNNESDYYWTIGITADGYTFTNADGQTISYGSSGTNFVMDGEKTVWTINTGVSDTASLVPEYTGFNIINATTTNRGFALRVLDGNGVVGAYSTSNMNNSNAGEYNFSLDIFMQGEGGVPPTPTVAAPTFNPAGGTYYEPQEVTISCSTADATIYYSFDSENGPWTAYEEAILVDEDKTIWAYASKDGYNDSPVVNSGYLIENDIVIIFWQEWEDDWDPWQGWTERCTQGDSLWRVASYGGNHYAYANGYNHPATVDWLISPAFDLDSYSNVVLTFNTARNYNGPDIEVYFSNDYEGQDPDLATWQPLECELSQGGWNWTPSGEISLDGFSGSNCYIGFKYISDEDAAGWEVDDIKLASGSTTPIPTLIATPNYLGDFSYVVGNGPSASQSYVLSGVNLEDEGIITVVSCSWYEISLDDETFTEVLEFPCTDLPVTIFVRMMEGLDPNTYDGVYIANIYGDGNNSANTVVNVSGVVHYENEPMMSAWMPLYIQGNNGSNNNRVPVAVHVLFTNLYPNTTYHYTNQFVDGNDGPETAGAGNVIYANPEGFYRTTSPSLATEGSYGVFTTDEEGRALVWLMNEPTANARFTPGNHVYMRVRLNDGAYGVNVLYTFTSEDYATVLNFGTENDEYSGSAFYVKSEDAPMQFASLYQDVNHMDRPIYSTSIETIGVDFGSINQYADFYKELVAGKDGWFGGILPNDNETGINIIRINDMEFQLVNEYETILGQWSPEANTVNPTNGLDEPIFIDLTDDGVEEGITANIKVWGTNHEFVIENGDNAHYTMTIYNVLGQPMMQQQINAGCTERIGHNLASGIYVISLQNNQNKVAVKVIVK